MATVALWVWGLPRRCHFSLWGRSLVVEAPRLSFKDRLPAEGGSTQPTQHHRQVPPASESVETVGCGDHPDGVEQGAPAQQRPVQLQHGLARAQQMLEARVPVVAALGAPVSRAPRMGAALQAASVRLREWKTGGRWPDSGHAGAGLLCACPGSPPKFDPTLLEPYLPGTLSFGADVTTHDSALGVAAVSFFQNRHFSARIFNCVKQIQQDVGMCEVLVRKARGPADGRLRLWCCPGLRQALAGAAGEADGPGSWRVGPAHFPRGEDVQLEVTKGVKDKLCKVTGISDNQAALLTRLQVFHPPRKPQARKESL